MPRRAIPVHARELTKTGPFGELRRAQRPSPRGSIVVRGALRTEGAAQSLPVLHSNAEAASRGAVACCGARFGNASHAGGFYIMFLRDRNARAFSPVGTAHLGFGDNPMKPLSTSRRFYQLELLE